MHFAAVLNEGGGTLKTTDVAHFAAHITNAFTRDGDTVEIHRVKGKALVHALEALAGQTNVDGIIAAGGDGTISLAAQLAWENDKVLVAIPAGTMNLFARSLGIPLDIYQAVDALAAGEERRCDIAQANGQPFIHQFAIGLHPRLVRMRSQIPHHSRIGKIMASIRAALYVFRKKRTIKARITLNGEGGYADRYGLIAVSNNIYGEGHLPYADKMDEGYLGLYSVPPLEFDQLIKVSLAIMTGRWRSQPEVSVNSAEEVTLELLGSRSHVNALIDGEPMLFGKTINITLNHKALKVRVPRG